MFAKYHIGIELSKFAKNRLHVESLFSVLLSLEEMFFPHGATADSGHVPLHYQP
jgi:hypothetical protein